MCSLPDFSDPLLLTGFSNNEDAGVYRISETEAIIATLDFFTPIVDDPYTFGAIAAVNSLSDVYAMGGKPRLALNILCAPDDMDDEDLEAILRGGADKIKEAGALLVGGHSVRDNEPKYGLSVIGFVDVDRVLINAGAKPGDSLILTKALGSGILTSAGKSGRISQEELEEVTQSMLTLNAGVTEALGDIVPHAAADITGFGLLGHLCEMMEASETAAEISFASLPLFEQVPQLSREGHSPGGSKKNEKHFGEVVDWGDLEGWERAIVSDPQTSGGLLLSVSGEDAQEALKRLKSALSTPVALIGTVQPLEDVFLKCRRQS